MAELQKAEKLLKKIEWFFV